MHGCYGLYKLYTINLFNKTAHVRPTQDSRTPNIGQDCLKILLPNKGVPTGILLANAKKSSHGISKSTGKNDFESFQGGHPNGFAVSLV